MSNHKATYQQQETVSINRAKLIEISQDYEYNKTDYRVFLLLLTQLNGFASQDNPKAKDPLNYKLLDIEQMSEHLAISKKDVKKTLKKLYVDGLIEIGSNDTIRDGYRFTF